MTKELSPSEQYIQHLKDLKNVEDKKDVSIDDVKRLLELETGFLNSKGLETSTQLTALANWDKDKDFALNYYLVKSRFHRLLNEANDATFYSRLCRIIVNEPLFVFEDREEELKNYAAAIRSSEQLLSDLDSELKSCETKQEIQTKEGELLVFNALYAARYLNAIRFAPEIFESVPENIAAYVDYFEQSLGEMLDFLSPFSNN